MKSEEKLRPNYLMLCVKYKDRIETFSFDVVENNRGFDHPYQKGDLFYMGEQLESGYQGAKNYTPDSGLFISITDLKSKSHYKSIGLNEFKIEYISLKNINEDIEFIRTPRIFYANRSGNIKYSLNDNWENDINKNGYVLNGHFNIGNFRIEPRYNLYVLEFYKKSGDYVTSGEAVFLYFDDIPDESQLGDFHPKTREANIILPDKLQKLKEIETKIEVAKSNLEQEIEAYDASFLERKQKEKDHKENREKIAQRITYEVHIEQFTKRIGELENIALNHREKLRRLHMAIGEALEKSQGAKPGVATDIDEAMHKGDKIDLLYRFYGTKIAEYKADESLDPDIKMAAILGLQEQMERQIQKISGAFEQQ